MAMHVWNATDRDPSLLVWVNDPRNLSQNYRLFDVPAAKRETPLSAMGFAKPENQKAQHYVKDFS
jgi:hypothetical protein